MPCPHLSRVNGDCLLQQDPGSNTDDGREPVVTELVLRSEGDSPLPRPASVGQEWCLGTGESYRDCPFLRRFLAELVP
jgi:hypothetical protein